MRDVFKNIEFKKAVFRLTVFMAFVCIVFCFIYVQAIDIVKERVSDQSAAVVGKISEKHPELEKKIIGVVTKGASDKDIKLGYGILSRYGYSTSISNQQHVVFKDLYFRGLLFGMLIIFFITVGLFFITFIDYREIYRKVRAVLGAAEKVVDGDFKVRLPAGKEGDFEILGHRFNQMANRLELSIEQLTKEKAFLKNILSDISHQLKTPLSTLILNNELMLTGAIPSKTKNANLKSIQSFLETDKHQLERIEWLIYSLLKIARLEAGTIQYNKRKISLADAVNSSNEALNVLARDKNVQIDMKNDSLDLMLEADVDWLSEAFINIIKNCIEHTHVGQKVMVDFFSTPLSLGIVISDTGDGIPQKDLPNIFKRFYKGSNSKKPNSIGIGLALSKTIIEGNDGSITVRSEINRGTEFTVTFLKTLGK